MYSPWGSHSLLLPMISSLYCMYTCSVIVNIYIYCKKGNSFNTFSFCSTNFLPFLQLKILLCIFFIRLDFSMLDSRDLRQAIGSFAIKKFDLSFCNV